MSKSGAAHQHRKHTQHHSTNNETNFKNHVLAFFAMAISVYVHFIPLCTNDENNTANVSRYVKHYELAAANM